MANTDNKCSDLKISNKTSKSLDHIFDIQKKYWKKDHNKAKSMTIKDLSDKDLLELKFEIVDAFHFLINFGVSIGMTGSEFYNLFVSKNQENTDRQNRGY